LLLISEDVSSEDGQTFRESTTSEELLVLAQLVHPEWNGETSIKYQSRITLSFVRVIAWFAKINARLSSGFSGLRLPHNMAWHR
jgi:hypothetical protein